jgi:hypothetical protein
VNQTRKNPQREFIRHTAGVPIEVRDADGEAHTEHSVNISHGGLAFTSERYLRPGSVITLRIPEVEPPFEAHARVAWCSREDGQYSAGVQFLEANDAFRARMVQQVCTIEKYRQKVRRTEGRELSSSEAAAEWISRYADQFPDS